MAGMNVVAIEREDWMIGAIRHRVSLIQARLSDNHFDYQQWYDVLAKEEYSDDEEEGGDGKDGKEEAAAAAK
jgi:hypothetical protein